MGLHDIDLDIAAGETLAIIGGSGSGKSTLLRLLIGLIRPTSGEIWIGDTEISRLSEAELDKVRLHMKLDLPEGLRLIKCNNLHEAIKTFF